VRGATVALMQERRKRTPQAIVICAALTLAFGALLGRALRERGEGEGQPVRVAMAPAGSAGGGERSLPEGGGSDQAQTGSAAAEGSEASAGSQAAPAASSAGGAQGQASEAAAQRSSASMQGSRRAPKARAGAPADHSLPKAHPGSQSPSATGPAAGRLPPIKHVFLIVLDDQGEGAAFGASAPDTYLARTLHGQGELLRDYYAVAGSALANEIALVSGQGASPQTLEDCPLYEPFATAAAGADGLRSGSGCVYPPGVQTLPGELAQAHSSWRAYIGGLEDAPAGASASCRRPVLGAADPYGAPQPGAPYVTWLNPFVYFSALIESGECERQDVAFAKLEGDLRSAASTPALSYIAPDLCEDGAPGACAPGAPSGLAAIDPFLERVVPMIERSPAYGEGGLIAITFDHAPSSGPEADTSGCCTTTPSATSAPGASGTSGSSGAEGGGKVGLLLISRYVKPGSENAIGSYNHYSLLLSIERLFGLQPLGYAAQPGLLAFDASVYNNYR